MASASVVFAKAKNGQPFIDHNFISSTVATGTTSGACPVGFNYCVVTALDGNLWAAFSSDTPDANVATARIPLTTGVPMTLAVKAGVKVAVLNRT